ncbi:MAG: response regulator, partial [Bacteroidetes bacterium]
TLEKEAFRFREFIEKVIGMHATIAQEKKIALETRLDTSLPEIIVTDQMILSQVIHNLLSNAVKFTPKGKVILEVRLKEEKKNKHLLEFSVTDTGIGIPADKLGVIFDVFSQADSSTVRQYGGSGLGLTITKRYLEMLHSRIMVESVSGKGSRFYFTLAVGTAGKASAGTEVMDNDSALPDLRDIRGLVVEDDPYNRLILKQLLSMWNLCFDEAENGLQAFEKAKQNHYHLILLDVHMPVMDGFEAARKIRELPGYSDTDIIALTADISDRIKQEVKTGLFTEVHIKPFEPEKINRRITEIAIKAKNNPRPPDP